MMRFLDNVQFKRSVDAIDDEDLQAVAGAVRAHMCGAIREQRTDANTEYFLLLAKMLFRIVELKMQAVNADGQKVQAWACIVEGAWHGAFKHELDAKEAGFATGKRFDLLPLTFAARPPTAADAGDQVPDGYMLVRKPQRGPFPPTLEDGSEWLCCGTYTPCRGECAVQRPTAKGAGGQP